MALIERPMLTRSATFTARAADEADPGDGLTLSGYAAVFNTPTLIDSWEGRFNETIAPGAFKKTLRENTPVMQFDHGQHPLIGSIPIGTYSSLSEDDQGLAVEGRLSDNWLVQPVRDAIASGAVSGMSFRFQVVRDVWTTADGQKVNVSDDSFWDLLYMGTDAGPLQRTLVEVTMPEAGPVVFPAYAETSVGVRAATLARSVMADPEMSRDVRAQLAVMTKGADVSHTVDLPADEKLRAQVARALLFGARIGDKPGSIAPVDMARQDAPPVGHPSEIAEAEVDDLTEGKDEQDDAPAVGHPSSVEDAPAAGRSSGQSDAPPEGHPSEATTQAERQRIARLAYVTSHRVGKVR